MLVVDASVLLATIMPDEAGFDLRSVCAPYAEVMAPGLLWVELRNVLLAAERRGRLPEGALESALEDVEAVAIVLDHLPRSAALIGLARQHRLSTYDALYLELALRCGADLATLDARLATAATAEGIQVVIYSASGS